MLGRTAVAVAVLAALVAIAGPPAHAACTRSPPVRSLVLEAIYHDARQSVPDTAAVQRNTALTAGIDQFLRDSEAALDHPGVTAGPGDPPTACAFANFTDWAAAGALVVEPKPFNREGTVKRGVYVIGLTILALKFREAGFVLDPPVRNWLRALADANTDFYRRSSNRGNLRIWAGAAAALHALVEPDPAALKFQDLVWHEAIGAIRDDGTIEGETARGQRALIYHMFSLSATLVLRSARAALGYRDTPQATARVRLLADMIGRNLCDPQGLQRAAGAVQEVPGDWAYRVPVGFGAGVLSADWSRCGRLGVALSDPSSGGDTRHSAALLAALGLQAPRRASAP